MGSRDRGERLEKLGEGIFGRVYKARDRLDSNQIVAVKQLYGCGGGPSVQTGFLELAREVTSLNKCRGQPSIVEFRNTLVDKRDGDGDSFFIVMEYAGRMNLRTYMLLAAVERSHQAGVLHRDVKPENVVVDDGTAPDVDDDDDRKKNRRHHRQPPQPPEEITCKLCDFGTSEPMTEGRREYSPLATSDPYSAPELFLGSADYDGRIDSWGLGCVMAELLVGTGGAFFEGRTRRTSSPTCWNYIPSCKSSARGASTLGPRQPAGSGRRSAAEERARGCPEAGRLREVFPEKVLSQAGFEVLSGLLESSPGGRLTAAEALQKPWFADDDQRTDEGRCEGPRRRRRLGACFMSCVTDDD
ncbi:hypothetical protein C2845_PM12G14480 [Panicum miliaceum]|uniref:[RNA-polymerase]-subunit kinase n=1 Tax=Panicum miliaceum TaxID=4540 RepID=A0A3L6QDD6_PANMI|nr:hypothetical protein C2845_PM12G14480 [Panicum miliaceum]